MKKIFILIILNFLNTSCFSQNIVLDDSFGVNGILELPYETLSLNGGGEATSIMLSNDKLLVLKGGQISGVTKSYLTRLNPNGSIDTTFGTNGFIIFNYTNYDFSLKVQADNKIIVFGGNNPVKLFRFLENGQPDSGFATNGLFQVTNVYNSFAHETTSISGERHNLILLPNNKILIRYRFSDNNIGSGSRLKCFNTDGLPDNSFGNNSELTNLNDNTISEFKSKYFFISDDNKILGYNSDSSSYSLEKFNLDGTHDLTFGVNGINQVNVPITNFYSFNITQDQTKRILVESISDFNSFNIKKYIRIQPSGSLDNSFGVNGILDDNFGIDNLYLAGTVYKNNKYYFGGGFTDSNFNFQNPVILSANDNGSLNQSFNSNGYFVDDTPTLQDIAGDISFQSDGKILIEGAYKINSSTNKVFFKRFINTSLENNQFLISNVFYTNPISDDVTFSSKKEIKKITLYNSLGEKIIESNKTTIKTSEISKGIYIANIEFEDNSIINKKIIKE